MALPSSPPITLAQICAEFGAPAGTPLSAFVRGGAYVSNTTPNAGVPTALPISLLDLLGARLAPPLIASAGPATVYGSAEVGYPIVTSSTCTATATGGEGPISYAWGHVSGDASIVPNSPTSASTTFRCGSASSVPRTISAAYRCWVTRSDETVVTNLISVSMSWS